MFRDLEWVYSKLAVSNVSVKDAPSTGAWGLLVMCKQDEVLRKQVVMSMISKFVPSTKSIDHGSMPDPTPKSESNETIGILDKIQVA